MAEEKKRGPGRPKGSKNKNSGNKTESAKKRRSSEEQRQEILEMQEQRRAHKKLMDEIWAVTIFATGVFLVITTQFNTTGAFGDAVHDILRGLFGVMTYVLPYIMMVFAVCLFIQRMQHINTKTVSFSVLIFIMLCVLNSARFIDPGLPAFALSDLGDYYSESLKGQGAGAIGMEIGNILVKFIGMPGLYILAITVIIISLLFVVDTPVSKQFAAVRDKREENRLLREQERELTLAASTAVSASPEKEVISPEYLSGTAGDQKAVDTVARSHRDIRNKKQILQYMNDDSTLRDGEGRTAAPGAMGLEQVDDPEPGKGLG
ncbi:DNA translocase FtsK 4TM domain-containing protein, partial [Mobilibacterium timonense]|uniref:DNA translocase FtsK 4TM domain-containing protein n=1 Tax=Mobilibacterium timonense TaxID=1871012 RepID=UPI003A8E1F01